MTAPRTCEYCGAALDAGDVCDCRKEIEQTTASMEFVMGTSLEALPKTIDFNFEELKSALADSLAHYNGLVVTADGIKPAKEDRAKLNKLREALETKRKEVKKECMAPYNDFEARVKELVGLIDKPIAAIDCQLKDFEDRRREEKREAIKEIYEETVGELRGLLPFAKLWRDEWYNTSFTLKKVREAILAAEDKAASDLEVLSTVESEFSEAVKLKYLEALDLNAALAERARLKEQAERLREYESRKDEACAPPPAPPAETVPPRPSNGWEAGGGAAVEETVYRLCFECYVTKAQAAALSSFLKDNNISYRRV